MIRQGVEARLSRMRNQETFCNNLQKHLNERQRWDCQLEAQDLAERRIKAREAKKEAKIQAERQEQLAKELVAAKRKEVEDRVREKKVAQREQESHRIREEALRQQVLNASPELRELQQKIKRHECSKVVATQLLEAQLKEAEDMRKEADLQQALADSRYEAALKDAQREEEALQAKVGFRKQAEEDYRLLNLQKEEEALAKQLKEKELIHQIVHQIEVEDRTTRENTLLKQEKVRQDLEAFQALQAQYQQAEHEEQALADARIQSYKAEKEERERVWLANKKVKDTFNEEIVAGISQQILEANKEKEEIEAIMEEYYWEMRELQHHEKEKAAARKKAEIRADMLRDYEAHLVEKARRKSERAEADRMYREELLQKYSENAKLDQMSAQKQRMKLQDFRRDVDTQVRLKKEQAEAEAREREKEELDRITREARRLQICEEERQKILASLDPDLKEEIMGRV